MIPIPIILNAIVTALLAVLVVLQLTVCRPDYGKRKKKNRLYHDESEREEQDGR